MGSTLGIRDFDFNLSEELTAQTPTEPHGASQFLILDKISGKIQHRHFYDITDYLNPNDCLILDDSCVLPARIYGVEKGVGARAGLLFLAAKGDDVREVLAGPSRRTKLGDHSSLGGGLTTAEILEVIEDGDRLAKFSYQGDFYAVLDQTGQTLLPPYIKKKLEDKERYQMVYSREVGSAVASIAGLHPTKELLGKIREKGIKIGYVMLHVGLGTFRPVSVDKIIDHKIHSERYWLSRKTADLANETKKNGNRVVFVGTTSCRTIEPVAKKEGRIKESGGFVNIFIYPGLQFKILDGLITNFHPSESTLIMLTSTLAGREHVLNAYRIAVQGKYWFFSFGNAMFIESRTG